MKRPHAFECSCEDCHEWLEVHYKRLKRLSTNLMHKWHGDISILDVKEKSHIRKRQIMLEIELFINEE